MSFRLISKCESNKPLDEIERSEWSSFGTLSNEVECSITEFKKGRIFDRDIIYFKAAGDFLNSILEIENEERRGGKIRSSPPARRESLTNRKMFVKSWIESKLPFPKNNKEYSKEMRGFIGAFEKMAQRKQPDAAIIDKLEKLFSFFGELALRKIHKSSLMGCHGSH